MSFSPDAASDAALNATLRFLPLEPADRPAFMRGMQEAFQSGVEAEFGAVCNASLGGGLVLWRCFIVVRCPGFANDSLGRRPGLS